ncbi:hypothetical protein V6N11_000146 [Hibiscus sabdariffa]|uniref:F-box associated domain-containing protein n=2 Tax=Hibiscus sabdariffa TaxID=183260 RepID=A0ABR2NNT4_9ROSI
MDEGNGGVFEYLPDDLLVKNTEADPCRAAVVEVSTEEEDRKWRSLRAPLHDVWCSGSPLVVVDNTLYWMIPNLSCENSTLMFSMDSEVFRTISHPTYPCKPGDRKIRHQWIRVQTSRESRWMVG